MCMNDWLAGWRTGGPWRTEGPFPIDRSRAAFSSQVSCIGWGALTGSEHSPSIVFLCVMAVAYISQVCEKKTRATGRNVVGRPPIQKAGKQYVF